MCLNANYYSVICTAEDRGVKCWNCGGQMALHYENYWYCRKCRIKVDVLRPEIRT